MRAMMLSCFGEYSQNSAFLCGSLFVLFFPYTMTLSQQKKLIVTTVLQMNYVGIRKNWSCHNLEHYPNTWPTRLRKSTKIISERYEFVGCAIAQAVSRRLPTAAARVHVGFVDETVLGRFSPSTSVSPANSHSTDYSTLTIYHPGLVQ
jgi:hypothetical protein